MRQREQTVYKQTVIVILQYLKPFVNKKKFRLDWECHLQNVFTNYMYI